MKKRSFDLEFKRTIVELLLSGKKVKDVCLEYNLGQSMVHRAYYIEELDTYFEYKSISEDGYTVQIQCYREYEMINGQWRGVLKEGELKTFEMNNGAAREVITM